MSIRTRLTLTFTALFGLIVLGLAIGSYILVRNSLFADLNTQLQVAVDATAMSAEHEFNEHEEVSGGEQDLQALLNDRRDAALPETQILVRQGSRQVAYKGVVHPAIDLRTVSFDSLRDRRVKNFRLSSRALRVAKFNSQYELYAGASTTSVTNRLNRFALSLLLFVPLGLAVAGSAGYVLAKKSLEPLNLFSATIDSVTSPDLGLRIKVESSDDEISKIGSRFNSLLDRLQHSFDSQQRFMADASHELRTPVTVALAAAQVTSRDPLRTLRDCDEALRMVEGQMLRVRNIVQDLLLLSQADASALRMNVKDLYLDDVVSEASRAARSLVRTKQQRLEIQALPEAHIRGDSDLLVKALMILLDNSVKFAPPGGAIGVGISRRGEHWVCHVSDDGIGIPEFAHAHVFERFFRVANEVGKKEGSGSGLGLAIAKAIVDNHGGTLKLTESRPGFTRFEMALPAAESEASKPVQQNQPNSWAVRI